MILALVIVALLLIIAFEQWIGRRSTPGRDRPWDWEKDGQ